MGDSTTSEVLDERYGRRRDRSGRLRVAVLAGVLAAALLAWVAWAAWHDGHQPVRGQLVGYVVVDATKVDVRLDVTTSHGQAAFCEMRASGPTGDVVGRTTVTVPGDGRRSRRLEATIPTASLAVNGVLHACRAS